MLSADRSSKKVWDFSVTWTLRLFVNASLSRPIPWRCVPDRFVPTLDPIVVIIVPCLGLVSWPPILDVGRGPRHTVRKMGLILRSTYRADAKDAILYGPHITLYRVDAKDAILYGL